MSNSLDRPISAYTDPPEDQQEASATELAQRFLAIAGQEGPTDPDVVQAIQILMAGLQSIGSQKAAAQAPAPAQPMSNASMPFDQPTDGQTTAANQPPPGQAWATLH